MMIYANSDNACEQQPHCRSFPPAPDLPLHSTPFAIIYLFVTNIKTCPTVNSVCVQDNFNAIVKDLHVCQRRHGIDSE